MTDHNHSPVKIVSAPWVLPMTAPAVVEGAVAMAGMRIVAVGGRREILARFPEASEERCHSLLMPGLVNGHCHLELSHLRDLPSPAPGASFTAWIAAVIERRARDDVARHEMVAAAVDAIGEMGRAGTVLVADIGNDPFPELLRGGEGWPEILSMLELLAPTTAMVDAALEKLAVIGDDQVVAAHAPYSTAAEVLVAVKARCRRFGQVFSVHCAESREEVEFVRGGDGAFARFLKEKRGGDLAVSFDGRGFCGSGAYLQALGLLDAKTLLVHGVHLSEEELRMVAASGSQICLCPGSNRALGVGRAPLAEMLAAGLLPALGSDSLASNRSLEMWREMRLLAEDHSLVAPQLILAMATLGGARALHRQADFGSLAPGRLARMLAVDSPDLAKCTTALDICRELVNGGRPPVLRWIGGAVRTGKGHNSTPGDHG